MKRSTMLMLATVFISFPGAASAECIMSETEAQMAPKLTGKLSEMVATTSEVFSGLTIDVVVGFDSTKSFEEIVAMIAPYNSVLPGFKVSPTQLYPTRGLAVSLPLCAIPRLLNIGEVIGVELNEPYIQHPSIRVGN